MTPSRLQLERFDHFPNRAVARFSAATVEEIRLAAFDQGHRAGWDDCTAAHNTDEVRQREAVAAHLQSLSFTFHEAKEHILRAVEPLLRDMVAKILPMTARHALVPTILELLQPAAEELAGNTLTIRVSPDARSALEAALARGPALPIGVIADESLRSGQACLILGRSERRIDLDGVVDAIGRALADFFAPEVDDPPKTGTPHVADKSD